MLSYTSAMSTAPASAPASAALALLRAELAPKCLVSTMPADPSHDLWTASEPTVCIGWSAPTTNYRTPGLIPWPILVWPVPETGEYVVSYSDTCEMATLFTLPETVRGLMDRVLSDRLRPTPRHARPDPGPGWVAARDGWRQPVTHVTGSPPSRTCTPYV